MKILPFHGLFALLAALALCVPARADEANVDKLNKKIDNFSLKTAGEQTFSLAELKDKKAVVAIGTLCLLLLLGATLVGPSGTQNHARAKMA